MYIYIMNINEYMCTNFTFRILCIIRCNSRAAMWRAEKKFYGSGARIGTSYCFLAI